MSKKSQFSPLELEILKTLKLVEGSSRTRHKKITIKFRKPKEPKTYKQYQAESKPPQYFIDKYNKKIL